MKAPDVPELVNTDEVAEMLRMSSNAVYTLRLNGKLPFVKIGRKIFFRKQAVVDFVKASETQLNETTGDTQ